MNSSRTRAYHVVIASLLCVPVALAAKPDANAGTVFVKASEIHVGNGQVIKDGAVLIKDGKIAAVGAGLKAPSNAQVVDMGDSVMTPGLIDANTVLEPDDVVTRGPRSARQVLHDIFCPQHRDQPVVGCCGSLCPNSESHVTGHSCPQCGFPEVPLDVDLAVGVRRGADRAEHASEIVPHTRIIDAVNLRSPDLGRLLEGGVTTIFVTPDSASVISSQGAIVRTGGPMGDRIVKDADAVKAALGRDPINRGRSNGVPFRKFVTFHSRRPTTRMGVTWVFRKAMHDTRRFMQGLDVYGADAPSPQAMKVLAKVFQKKIPLRILAREQRDILTALRLSEEFQLPFILEEATEAHLCARELGAANVPVIYGPIIDRRIGFRGTSGEGDDAKLGGMAALLDAGIQTALTANDLRDEAGLARQAMCAIRYGVTEEDALKSVTLVPAQILGIGDTHGSIEKGKHADIVVWKGRPFDATAVPAVVMINGKIVLDRRG
ncbi:MAG: amidohydrolase family protein [Phycisphaerae bacterium]